MSRKQWLGSIAGVSLVFAVAACGDRPAASGEADNTGVNVRDREGTTVTPMDQSNAPADIEMTTKIRQALVDDGSLSTSAKNIKVVTAGGAVTLRGPVASEKERAMVVATAQKIAGAGRVTSQLEVAN